ncbi:class II histone deacetylase [Dictyobacter aurantiacus]|uniref:Histone deacetylase n=1 Tax=Dictyobacter aurantiacus TaxID=1936993 RepID=A0A401Z7Q6_9CHLR|nr:class II histone deacetylase [Dictyobacter aurantiacus]GCE02883.1 histone deacetylase [Dictyobacter aurantiacus]
MDDTDRTTLRTGLVYDERFLEHDTGSEARVRLRTGTFELSPQPHPSAAIITQRSREFLDGAGLSAQMQRISARPASATELSYYHTPEYIDGIAIWARENTQGPLRAPWGEIDEETVLSPGSLEAALYAAGGAMNAVQAVLEGRVSNAFALLRPPGHHATSNQAMGFCIFNNVVVAAHYARRVYGLERIMIIDWDVHHGNGTQDAFYEDAGVLFVSLHQQDWFPENSGTLEQVGCGAGEGYTINIPLPPGTGDRGYRAAFERIILPIGRQYQPQLILISAGQDACWLDPLAQMMMTMDGYRDLATMTVKLATEVCEGHLVVLTEGGYSAPYAPYCSAATVEALMGADTGIIDLYDTAPELKTCQTIFSHDTRQALQRALTRYQQWWRL